MCARGSLRLEPRWIGLFTDVASMPGYSESRRAQEDLSKIGRAGAVWQNLRRGAGQPPGRLRAGLGLGSRRPTTLRNPTQADTVPRLKSACNSPSARTPQEQRRPYQREDVGE